MQYPEQKHQITVNVDSRPAQPITNLEAGIPAIGGVATPKYQPTGLKTALVVGGICGLTGLSLGTVIGANQQNYQLDRAKSNLVQTQGDKEAIKREAAACLKRIERY